MQKFTKAQQLELINSLTPGENKLTKAQEDFIMTNRYYTKDQLIVLVGAFLYSLTLQQVKLFANPKLPADQMSYVANAMVRNEMSTEEAKDFLKPIFKQLAKM